MDDGEATLVVVDDLRHGVLWKIGERVDPTLRGAGDTT